MNLTKKRNLLGNFPCQKRFLLFTLELVISYSYRWYNQYIYMYIMHTAYYKRVHTCFLSNPMRNLYMIWMLFNSHLMKRKSESIYWLNILELPYPPKRLIGNSNMNCADGWQRKKELCWCFGLYRAISHSVDYEGPKKQRHSGLRLGPEWYRITSI